MLVPVLVSWEMGEIGRSGAAKVAAFLPSSSVLRWETYLPAAWVCLRLGQRHSDEGPVD